MARLMMKRIVTLFLSFLEVFAAAITMQFPKMMTILMKVRKIERKIIVVLECSEADSELSALVGEQLAEALLANMTTEGYKCQKMKTVIRRRLLL